MKLETINSIVRNVSAPVFALGVLSIGLMSCQRPASYQGTDYSGSQCHVDVYRGPSGMIDSFTHHDRYGLVRSYSQRIDPVCNRPGTELESHKLTIRQVTDGYWGALKVYEAEIYYDNYGTPQYLIEREAENSVYGIPKTACENLAYGKYETTSCYDLGVVY